MQAIRFVLLLTLSCWLGSVAAQKKEPYIMPAGTWLLRINPLGIVDPIETNFSLGTEYRFQKTVAASLDVAYVMQSLNMQNAKDSRGVIVRPAIRKYFDPGLNTFVEAELHYKMIESTLEDWVGRKTVNGVPAYQEFKRFHFKKKVAGFHFKLGVQESLVQQKWLWLEAYAGLGLRHRWQETDLPADATYQFLRQMFTVDRNEGSSTMPAFVGGVRLLFKLN